MEKDRILNVGDDLDIYSLHIVLLPLLRKAINSFIHGWNNHKVKFLLTEFIQKILLPIMK